MPGGGDGRTDAAGDTILCKWCGLPTSAHRGVCEACGSPLTERATASPRVSQQATRVPAPPVAIPAGQAPRPQQARVAATARPGDHSATDEPSPSRSVHAAKLVSLIVSLAPGTGGETAIRFFTPEGMLVAQVASGSLTYEEALRLVLS